MYNLAPANAPWFEHLTDSVRGLGEAALEWQIADRAATLAEAHVRMESRLLHEGKATYQPGPDTRGWDRRPHTHHTPHVQAFFKLQRIYMEHRFLTRREYHQAAMLYASGAAWAIGQVQAGEQPHQVVFDLDGDEQPAPIPHAYQIKDLGNYVHARKIELAYQDLLSREMACEHAEEIAGRDYVADHEASEMWDAADAANGMEDVAYAYGLLAEQALQFALLGVKDAHRKQLAAARAEQQTAAEGESL